MMLRLAVLRLELRSWKKLTNELFKCPFCDIELTKDEMRFHVGIPLCMDIRKQKVPMEIVKNQVTSKLDIPVGKLDLEYYGEENVRKLIAYMWDRTKMLHPDEGKPFPLEKFRKGEDPFKLSPEEEKREKWYQEVMESTRGYCLEPEQDE